MLAATADRLPLERAISLVPASSRGAIGDLSGHASIRGTYSLDHGKPSFMAVVSAPAIKVAGQDLSDVNLRATSNADGTSVKDIRFTWSGGKFSADPVLIPPNNSNVALALSAEKVDLQKAMKIVLQDRVSGTGSVSGRIPVALNGSKISFGQGILQSDGPGTLRLGGATPTIAEVLDETDPSFKTDRGQQVKKQVLESIQDFQYDRLSAIFIPGENGLVVSVNIQGQGRIGAKQPLDITLNFHGFERGLNTYLAGRSRVLRSR
jgi:hypothetical protein